MKITKSVVVCALAALLPVFGTPVRAQSYPTKPVRVIVPFPPGGPVDTLARILGQRLGKSLGAPFIVENRPGAGGNIGADVVAKSTPDGHTLLLSIAATLTVNPSLYSNMPFDPVKDLAPIARIGTAQFVLVTRPSLEARSVKDLLALARSRPGQLKYASSGNGTEPHLSGELLKSLGDLDIIHVPYKGGAPSVAAVMSGEVDFAFQAIIAALSNIKSGRLKALAVTGRSPSSALPGVPTMIESGLPDFEVTGWYAVLGPDGIPDAIVQRLNQEIGAALNEPDVKERFERLGTEVAFSTPSELTALIKHDAARWARLVKLSGARIE